MNITSKGSPTTLPPSTHHPQTANATVFIYSWLPTITRCLVEDTTHFGYQTGKNVTAASVQSCLPVIEMSKAEGAIPRSTYSDSQ